MIKTNFIETKKGRICYLDNGHGKKTLVFIHGWIGWPVLFGSLAQRFGPLGYRVIAPYLPGHGDSFVLPTNFGFEDLVETVAEFLDKVRVDNNLVIIGQSIGGAVAWELATDKGTSDMAIVLVDPFLVYSGENPLTMFLDWGRGQLVDISHYIKNKLLGKIVSSRVDGFKHVQFSPRKLWYMIRTVKVDEKPRVPILALWGEQDYAVPIKRYKPVLNDIELHTFPGSHYWFGWQQKEFFSVLEDFLERQ